MLHTSWFNEYFLRAAPNKVHVASTGKKQLYEAQTATMPLMTHVFHEMVQCQTWTRQRLGIMADTPQLVPRILPVTYTPTV